jgi:hypothetical protein
MWWLEKAFGGVGSWSERTGKRGSFPTGEDGPTASPHVSVYRIVELGAGVVEQRFVRAVDIGLDPYYPDPNWAGWRQTFTAVNAYAHSQGFFHGFPDFHRLFSDQVLRLRVYLLKAGSGISWQDVPATEIFPDPAPLPVQSFVNREGMDWMRYINLWARSHGFMAGLPTGWTAQYDGTWVVGVVLLQSQAGTVHFVHGNEIFDEEECALQTNPPPMAPTPSAPLGFAFPPVGTSEVAELAIDEAPFGTRIHAPAAFVDYARCLVQRKGALSVPLLGGPNRSEGIRMDMRPRTDGRTLVFFGNESTAGAWIVGHQLNAGQTETVGEVASSWRARGTLPTFAFEVTTGVPAPGQTVIHSIGFVKQGILGVADPVMSFSWSSFLRLSPGMNLTFVWR